MSGKRTIWIAALLAAALGLTACSRDGEDGLAGLAFVAAPNYIAEELSLPVETGLLYGGCTDGENMYLLIFEDGRPALYRVPLDGREAEALAEYAALSEAEGAYYSGIWGPLLGGDGKLWLWEQYTLPRYELPEDFNGDSDFKENYRAGQDEFCHLRQLDPRTGRELNVVDTGGVVSAMKRAETLLGLTVDSQGTIYIGTNQKITALDGGGKVLFTLDARIDGSADETLALLPDGTAIALADGAGGSREVRSIDPAARGWGGTRYGVTGSTQGLASGSGPYQFFCQRSNTLYGRLEGERLDERLLRWEDGGLGTDANVVCFALLEDGRAAVLTWTRPEGGSSRDTRIRLQLLTPSEQLPSDGKIKLVYGTIGDDGWARTRVNQFNESSGKYYIELRDYAEGMLDSHSNPDYIQIRDAALKRLSAEMIAGRVPDILDDREIPLSALARQGALADLWPFIENDPELGRERVMEHVLECAGTDGKLYRVFSNFRIDTLAVSAEIAGGRTGWTPEEMLDAFGGTMPEAGTLINSGSAVPVLIPSGGEQMLDTLLRMDLDRYVDWAGGECSFDSEAFRNALRLCAGVKESGELRPAVLWEGQPILVERCISSVSDLIVDDAVFGGPAALTDYEARMAENGILSRKVKADGVWVGVVDQWLNSAEEARETGLLFGAYPVAADFVTGAVGRGGYAAYIGFPAESGSGSSFRIGDCLAITGACRDKEGAWAFVRQILLPGGSLAGSGGAGLSVFYDAFPVNKADFEALFQPQWLTDDAGAEVLDGNGERIEQAASCFGLGDPVALMVFQCAPTREQRDRLMALYNSTDHISDWENDELLGIIREQAQACFAGDKSPEETAALIQNRAALYVNESR